jgi:hypothetical protein
MAKENKSWVNGRPRGTDWEHIKNHEADKNDKSLMKWVDKQVERSKMKFPSDHKFGFDSSHGKQVFLGPDTEDMSRRHDQTGLCYLCDRPLGKGPTKKEMGEYPVHEKCPPYPSFKSYMKGRK